MELVLCGNVAEKWDLKCTYLYVSLMVYLWCITRDRLCGNLFWKLIGRLCLSEIGFVAVECIIFFLQF